MVSHFGDFDTTETVIIPFNTFSSDDPAASVTITNLAAADVEIHKDGGTTQRASDNGVTVTIDFDGITGNHIVSIDLSDNSDAGFYANGSTYQVRMEGTTVDAGTINAWIGSFSIGRVLRPTTDGRTLDVTANGEAGIDWGNIGNPGTTVDLSATTTSIVDTATAVTTVNGLAANTITAASIAADAITNAKIANDAIGATEIADGAIDAATFAAGAIDAAAIAANAIGASELATDAVDEIVDQVWDEAKAGHVGAGSMGEEIQSHSLSSEISALNDISAANVNTEVNDVIDVDTRAEPGQGAPGSTITLAAKIDYLYKAWRNRSTQTSTTYSLYDDATTTVDQKATVSDDGTTFDKGEVATGP